MKNPIFDKSKIRDFHFYFSYLMAITALVCILLKGVVLILNPKEGRVDSTFVS